MLESMPSALLTEWMAFDELEPISAGYRGDVQAALIASTMANAWMQKNDGQPWTVADFMPEYRPKEPKAAEDVYAMVRTWAMLNGALR